LGILYLISGDPTGFAQYYNKFYNAACKPYGFALGQWRHNNVMLSAAETSHRASTLIGEILRFALNDTREKSFACNRRGLTVGIPHFRSE